MISFGGMREERPVARRRPCLAAERPPKEIIEGAPAATKRNAREARRTRPKALRQSSAAQSRRTTRN
ncbi:MAG TPA: hypothetical protein VF339_08050, partial [Gammaproteobacteria bacterium]